MPNIAELPRDRIALRSGNGVVQIAERYDVQLSALDQPAAFSCTLGSSAIAAEILAQYPIGSTFQLLVGGNIQFTGIVDGFSASGSDSGTTITLRGRDRLGQVIDAVARNEESFKDPTFEELTRAVLTRALPGQDWTLRVGSDDAGRKVRTGTGPAPKKAEVSASNVIGAGLAVQKLVAATLSGVATAANVEPLATNIKAVSYKIQLGESYYSFLKKELDRVGLMLWCSATGDFILGKPDTQQGPRYKIGRTAHGNGRPGSSKIISYTLQNETTRRYNVFEVHGRTGGGKNSRSKVLGRYVDREMFSYGLAKGWAKKDDRCTTAAQAEFLARRACAEARRAGWSLTYVLAGHTTEGVDGSRAVWAPDTIVDVQDDVIGIRGSLYVDSVTFASGPESNTTVKLMRPEDVLLGDEADGPPIKTTKASKAGNPGTEGFLERLGGAVEGVAKSSTLAAAQRKGTIEDAVIIDVLEGAFKIDLNS